MIQYLSDLIKSSLSEKIVQLGLSDAFVGSLVRGGLILLVLLTCWIIHQIVYDEGEFMETYIVEDISDDPTDALWRAFQEVTD